MSEQEVLVVAEIREVRDAERLQQYQAGARSQIAKYGGKVVARGTRNTEVDPFGMLLVQSWPSEQAFLNWQKSDEYQPLKELRRSCADMRIAVVPVVQSV